MKDQSNKFLSKVNYQAPKQLNTQALLSFSLGKTDSLTTMKILNIETEEELFLLMAQAKLSMPKISVIETQKMVNQLNQLINSTSI